MTTDSRLRFGKRGGFDTHSGNRLGPETPSFVKQLQADYMAVQVGSYARLNVPIALWENILERYV